MNKWNAEYDSHNHSWHIVPEYAYKNGKRWYQDKVCDNIGKDEDARLIAASPDMLSALMGAASALRKALPHIPPDDDAIYCGEWLVEIDDTIAKAKGD